MGKKKEPIFGIGPDGSQFKVDSNEEKYFTWWLYELKLAGYVLSWKRAEPYTLTPGISDTYNAMKGKKIVVRSQDIIPETVYTPDFEILFNTSAKGVFFNELWSNERTKKEYVMHAEWDEEAMAYRSIVEVKPCFDFNNMTRSVKTKIAWVYHQFGDVVNLIIPDKMKGCLFDQTFTPYQYSVEVMSKMRKTTKIKWTVRSMSEYTQEQFEQVKLF